MAILCLLAVLLASSAVPAAEAEGELCIRNASGTVVWECPMREGESFAIRYTHSVALSTVEDHFVIKNAIIHLDKTIYHDFGAGLPSVPEQGQIMTTDNGRIVMSGYDRSFESFDVRVGRVARHMLLLPFDNKMQELPLANFAPAGSALTFSYAPQGCGEGPRVNE